MYLNERYILWELVKVLIFCFVFIASRPSIKVFLNTKHIDIIEIPIPIETSINIPQILTSFQKFNFVIAFFIKNIHIYNFIYTFASKYTFKYYLYILNDVMF